MTLTDYAKRWIEFNEPSLFPSLDLTVRSGGADNGRWLQINLFDEPSGWEYDVLIKDGGTADITYGRMGEVGTSEHSLLRSKSDIERVLCQMHSLLERETR